MTRHIEYLAGLFDGEGSFSIQVDTRGRNPNRPSIRFAPSLSLNLYYGSEVLDHFVDAFGGQIYPYQKNGIPAGRRWHLGRKETVLSAALCLEPYLEIKQDICRRFIRAINLFPDLKGVNKSAGQRSWTVENALEVAEIALNLNPARSRKSNKTAEYVEFLREALTRAEPKGIVVP